MARQRQRCRKKLNRCVQHRFFGHARNRTPSVKENTRLKLQYEAAGYPIILPIPSCSQEKPQQQCYTCENSAAYESMSWARHSLATSAPSSNVARQCKLTWLFPVLTWAIKSYSTTSDASGRPTTASDPIIAKSEEKPRLVHATAVLTTWNGLDEGLATKKQTRSEGMTGRMARFHQRRHLTTTTIA